MSFPVLQVGKPAVVLAPMEGVTDFVMRSLLTRAREFDFCVSEFLRVSNSLLPAKVYRAHVPELAAENCATPSGVPVQIQLLGGNAELLALSAVRAVEVGAQAIDLNFGCPAPTVNRHDGGATLLKFPARIFEIVLAVRRALPANIPLSAKLRLGWDDPDAIFENAHRAAEAGASWITIHGRTKMQGYQPPAYYDAIGRLRAELKIPVVANGEIWTLEDFKRAHGETGCHHYMLGRGALADPGLALQIRSHLHGSPVRSMNEPDWHHYFLDFAQACGELAQHKNYLEKRIKQWIRFASMRSEVPWFQEAKRAGSFAEILSLAQSNTPTLEFK